MNSYGVWDGVTVCIELPVLNSIEPLELGVLVIIMWSCVTA